MNMSKALLGELAFCFVAAAPWGFGQAGPAFEVASVKPAAPLDRAQIVAGKIHLGMNVDGARVDIGNMPLAELIRTAYRVKPYQIAGPDWMKTERFDILAKLPDGTSQDQVPDMLQKLLAERFQLAIHRESKEQPVYALVVGRNGLKLKESPPEAGAAEPAKSDDAAPVMKMGQVTIQRDGNGMVIKGSELGSKARISPGANGTMRLESAAMKLDTFTDFVGRFVDRPVVDMTGLKGAYQMALELSMDDLRSMATRMAGIAFPGGDFGALRGGAAGPGGAQGPQNLPAASDPSGGSIFQSVEQLGLKLEPRKAPIDLIVVDHLEKAPTEN